MLERDKPVMLRSQPLAKRREKHLNEKNSTMKSKVIASSYFTAVTADSLSAFYGKIKEMEKQSRQKAKLISGIVQFVKYEYIEAPEDDMEDIGNPGTDSPER